MPRPKCTDCDSQSLPRRQFLQASAATLVAAAAMPRFLSGAPTKSSAAESLIGEFFTGLSNEQRQTICLPYEHELRSRVNANWHVTKPLIGSDFFNKKQQEQIEQIVKKVTSEEGYERLQRQMDDDDGGLEAYSIACSATRSRLVPVAPNRSTFDPSRRWRFSAEDGFRWPHCLWTR